MSFNEHGNIELAPTTTKGTVNCAPKLGLNK